MNRISTAILGALLVGASLPVQALASGELAANCNTVGGCDVLTAQNLLTGGLGLAVYGLLAGALVRWREGGAPKPLLAQALVCAILLAVVVGDPLEAGKGLLGGGLLLGLIVVVSAIPAGVVWTLVTLMEILVRRLRRAPAAAAPVDASAVTAETDATGVGASPSRSSAQE